MLGKKSGPATKKRISDVVKYDRIPSSHFL